MKVLRIFFLRIDDVHGIFLYWNGSNCSYTIYIIDVLIDSIFLDIMAI